MQVVVFNSEDITREFTFTSFMKFRSYREQNYRGFISNNLSVTRKTTRNRYVRSKISGQFFFIEGL